MRTFRPFRRTRPHTARALAVLAAATTLGAAGAGGAGAQTTPAPVPAPSLPAPGAPTNPTSSPVPAAPQAPAAPVLPGTPAAPPPASPNVPASTPATTPSAPTAAQGGALAAPVAGAAQPGPLTLGAAARLAAAQSANSEAARYRVRQARARLTESRSALLPTVSALASQNQRTFNTASFGISFPSAPGQRPLFDPAGQVAGPVNIYDLRARVAANLFDASALERVRAARTLVRAGASDADNQAQLAAGAAAQAYLRAQRADAQVANRAADSVLAAELVNIAVQQLRAGTGVALDVTRSRAQFAATRAALIAARGDRERARLDLARALGLQLDAPLALADTLGAAADAPVADEGAAVRQALARRADLRAAADQLAAARQQAEAIRAERLPSVQAFVDDGTTGLALDRRLLNTYTYGVQVNVPIYDGSRREGRLEEQRAAAGELDVRRRDLEAQTAVDVRGALLDLRTTAEQARAAQERRALAQQEVAQARERFQAGVAGSADVVTASQSLTAARTAYADALAARQAARIALARAQGAVTDLP